MKPSPIQTLKKQFPGSASLGRVFALTALILVPLSAAQGVDEIDVPTHRVILDNGLVVLLAPDPSAPLVAVRLFYKAGSRNEHAGITGVAHLFEHMMFNGTAKYGPKMFDRELELAGGAGNAFTSHDLTCYTTTVPRASLETVLELESDRMTGLRLEDEILSNERQVVLEERRQNLEDSPGASTRAVFMASLFQAHPYRWPIFGWRSDVANLSSEACRNFYKTYYAPNNAVLAIAGDLEVEATMKLIEEKFGGIERGPEVPPVHTKEPEREFSARSIVTRSAPNPTLYVGFQGPTAKDEDHAVLDLVDEILSAGPTARLRRRLVLEDKVATSVYLSHDWTIDAEPLYVAISLHPGGDPEQAEAILHEELRRIASEPVARDELERAIISRTAALVRGNLETPMARAEAIGRAEVLTGDHRRIMKLPEIWRSVTPKRLLEVAAKYFNLDVAVVTVLIPEVKEKPAKTKEEAK